MKPSRGLLLGGVLAAAAAVGIGSQLHRGWGATTEEQAEPLPGDDLIPDPRFRSTRAITVNAPPEAVWPWLAQMGMGRAGWYSYDWLAQVFSSVSTRSTARIIPALQDIKTGDPIDFLDRMVFTVAQAIPGETLVLVADENQRPLQPWVKSWSFILNRLPSGATRLLIREISAWDSRLVGFLTSITGWAWFMATRRQLKNIKALAEAT